jgi:galactose oxidase
MNSKAVRALGSFVLMQAKPLERHVLPPHQSKPTACHSGMIWSIANLVRSASVLLIILGLCSQPAAPQTDPSVVGQWSPVQTWPFMPAHTHVLPNGNVLSWPTFDQGDNPQIWSPASGTATPSTPAGYNIFCSGFSFLSNGKLLVTGGHNGSSGYGLPYASLYDYTTDSWTPLPNMNAGRWYPTNTTLANGDVLVVSGEEDPTTTNPLPQVWQVGSSSWRSLTNAQLVQALYPAMFVAPNGKVFNAGPWQATRYLDTSGTGAWSAVTYNLFGTRSYGPAVMYEPGKVILIGGGDPPTATAEIIDLNASSPSFQYTSPMANARRQANATILPDGKIFVSGGSSGSGFDNSTAPVNPTEMWNPANGLWTTMASIALYRGYHSTAVLLPDGRVLEGGGESTGASVQIFSPPYLFQGTRPSISSAPTTTLAYNQTFLVSTPDAASITQVTLVRLPSTTHTLDMNQRFNRLTFTQAGGGLNVTTPQNGNLAPPGHYMLFILNSGGVPSVAAIVQLDNVPVSNTPAAPTNLIASATSSSQINLSWTDNSTNEDGFKIEQSTDNVNFSQIATVGPGVTTYSNTGLSAAATYYYRVRASSTLNGDSNYSNTAQATTAGLVAAPSSLAAAAVSSSEFDLSWTDNSSTED